MTTTLLATLNFSLSGGRGYYPSPSVNGIMCIPLGNTLHQTLSYNLVPENVDSNRGDSALWEHEPASLPIAIPKQPVSGYANLYTWPSRMIYLESETSGNVVFMRFVAGHGFDVTSNIIDPMQPYKTDKEKGRLPVQFREDRGTWRDFDSLIPDSSELAPLTIQNALRLAGKNLRFMPGSVLVLGLRYTPPNANVDFWRMERFVLPEVLATNRFSREDVRQFLDVAEETQKTLWQACSDYARGIISHGDRDPDKKDISKAVKQMTASSLYWSMIESRFHETLSSYTLEADPDDIRCQWLKSVLDALCEAWEQHAASVATNDAWTLRSLMKSEGLIRKKMKELKDEIQKYEPREVGA
ncbi:type I-E CRISPR-associated protein Cse1/CasA [Nitrincola iocasae]|uniref:Type I-E CRISPR-associated protein Cse1/CasA n=1 Tax=Nitrincola iocasae TaxID=2614693 RepID=A0A5J6LA95_9GAMM|nr:type I-E CRISPR-associated protein Cse1/CasA [Nitrincola iocasae]QEW05306.1 type I-E CRISPR-associated protein Cse1/CasA [Nitrincola iocasae]